MSNLKGQNNFDVISQTLEGKFTIEASAGTGKTYSLAILVLRLILEKKLPIEQILLVTFTEAAAGELKERTNKFIRLALLELEDEGKSKDKTITELVKKNSHSKEEIKALLNEALLDIDKATMSTIHSFCQQTLNEFAFETGQVFGKELITDISEIVEKEVNTYWRENIAISDVDLWNYLNINKKSIWKQAVEKKLNGQEFCLLLNSCNSLDDLKKCEEIAKLDFLDKIESQLPNLKKLTNKGVKYLESAEAFFNYLSKKDNEIKFDFLEIFAKEIAEVRDFKAQEVNFKRSISHYFLNTAANQIIPNIQTRLEQKNALTFDSLIKSLYEKREDERLQKFMREKYKAVFVDEFQDTDPYQYGIFEEIFQKNEESILFFIGDPKQSIYAWRQADLETYHKARNSEGMTCLQMNTNFRSSYNFISAANAFFKADNKLNYIDVSAHENKKTGLSIKSIQIVKNHSKDDELYISLESTLRFLFSGEVKLNGENVDPSNLAVLVRTGAEGTKVKRIMSRLNIPSVILKDESIFASQEALDLKELINALLTISKNNIDRVLITQFVGLNLERISQTIDDKLIPLFYELKELFDTNGVFVMFTKFLEEFELIKKWQNQITVGHQKLANMQQLVTILQQAALQSAMTPSELFLFLSQKIKEKPKNEYEQGIESDENAAKIMTIHKSKGLEFDIVIIPNLNLEAKEGKNWDFADFRKKEVGEEKNTYYFSLKGLNGEAKKLFEEQQQEENERLLYVALTRAKYNAFLFTKNGNHLLSPFVENAANNPMTNISVENFNEAHEWSRLSVNIPPASASESDEKLFPKIVFADKNYHKLSYSFLAGSHGKYPKENSKIYETDNYDKFVFKDLPKGAHIGNLLHTIFEFIDFTDDSNWIDQIKTAVQRYVPSKLIDVNFLQNLFELVKQVLYATIEIDGVSFCLNTIPRKQRINELEFSFPIQESFNPFSLNKLLEENDKRQIATNPGQVKGMMNGFVDLFFEHKGKYYILDWKSNFLGDDIDYYNSEYLLNAMNESNYHLQYLIYALAIDKFMTSRLGNDFQFEKQFGGVIYLFLRGNRAGAKSGVFTQLVKKEELLELKKILK
jgi:exodeoxyribonuclease V beta subunit